MFKKIHLPAVLVLLLVNTAVAADSWKLVLKTEIKSPDNVAGVPGVFNAGFIDESFCLATYWHCTAFYTVNGGKNWVKTATPLVSEFLNELEILDKDIAWVGVGFSQCLTTNGGRDWKRISEPGSSFMGTEGNILSFIDRKNGWLGLHNQLFVTRDGGADWTEIPVPSVVDHNIIAVNLLSESAGYILLNTGVIYQTKDNGKNWALVNLPMKNKTLVKSLTYSPVEALRFLNEKYGIAVLYLEKPLGFVVFETIDGGENWVEENIPTGGRLLAGSAFLSRDGKYLTINDINNKEILLYKHSK